MPNCTQIRASTFAGHTGPIRSAGDLLLLPVVALIESCIHPINAPTPEYVPITALARTVAQWPGRPVMLGHPQKDGRQISADSPGMRDQLQIGVILDARIEGNKLCMNIAIDPNKADNIGASHLIARLTNNEACEVSVGAYVVTINTPGTFNGRPYDAIWETVTPDHLAILPRGKGACSYDDGCGVRAATQHVNTQPRGIKMNDNERMHEAVRRARAARDLEKDAAPTGYPQARPPAHPSDDPNYDASNGTPPDGYKIALTRAEMRDRPLGAPVMSAEEREALGSYAPDVVKMRGAR